MGRAVLLTQTGEGRRACASAARISTTGGGAVEQFLQAKGDKKDVSLVKKVLASGHQSIFEHQTYFVGFENVSAVVEQFAIESRLGSYTVKSRRYVDFSGAGYVTPEELPDQEAYKRHMDRLFSLYQKLLDAGISREDARFVLPYCFCSNFYMTMNARELCRLVLQMTQGRGANMPEIKSLGESLVLQIEEQWPGVIDSLNKGYTPASDCWELSPGVHCEEVVPRATLTRAEENAQARLEEALRFTGRKMSVAQLVSDPRARELEFLTYEFHIENASLACVTHFTRHRMQSILVPDIREGLSAGHYIVPEAVRESKLYGAYCNAFDQTREECLRMLALGMKKAYAAYYAPAGMTIPLKLRMNARELALFLRLRTCERAQWEIRALARDMLRQLRESAPDVFSAFGPSCKVLGTCPEGRLSCGNPPKI